MIAYKLTKNMEIYKNQFESFIYEIFGDHRMDRYSIDIDSLLFKIRYMIKNNKDYDKIPELKKQFIERSLQLRDIFGKFMYLFIIKVIGFDERFNKSDIIDLLAQDVKIDSIYVKFKLILISNNKEYLEFVNNAIEDNKIFNFFPDKYFRFNTDSYNDGIAKAYPELFVNKEQNKIGVGKDADVYCHSFTFQTSEDCSLLCSYCYMFNKSNMKMNLATAKKFIDNLLDNKYGYINIYNSPAIIIEFIGGEPLLEIKLTRKIYEYFLEKTYEMNHPWFKLHRLSICSNGLQYFDDDVQNFFKDYACNISFNISIDGNRELHDSCRIQPNGEGSYDIGMIALNHYNKYYAKERNSKMTLAPSNIKYLYDSVVNFIENDMLSINLNCVFEEGWNQKTALIEYNELKKLSDYIINNNKENVYISIFNERQEDVSEKTTDGNFCFKEGTQILTILGNRNVEDININDALYTASGSIHRVSVMNSMVTYNTRTLYAAGIFPIECTSDHKFFAKKYRYTNKKGKNVYHMPKFIPINQLNVKDIISLPLLKNETDVELLKRTLSGGIVSTIKRIINNNENKYSELEFTSFSEANDILIYLRSLGYFPICSIIKGQYSTLNKVIDRWTSTYIISFNPRILNNNSIWKYDIKYNALWTEIQNIENQDTSDEVTVYCPTVVPIFGNEKEEHTIIANGVAVHQCGGVGSMLAMRPNGQFYSCIRFMPTSVGDNVKDLCLGNVEDGMIGREQESEVIKLLDSTTRRSQVNDICYECPINNDCPGCNGVSQTVFGTPNKRATFICIQTIAEALANVYHWNLLTIKHPEYKLPVRRNNVPDEWSLLIIDKEELELLKLLELKAMSNKIEYELQYK